MCKTVCFLEGMALGIAAGIGVACVAKNAIKNNKKLAKGSNQIEKAVNEFVDGIQTMIK